MNNIQEYLDDAKPSDLINVMLDIIENPIYPISVYTFGDLRNNRICYACIATNILSKIADIKIKGKAIKECSKRSKLYGFKDCLYVNTIESALDNLRKGNFNRYNEIISFHHPNLKIYLSHVNSILLKSYLKNPFRIDGDLFNTDCQETLNEFDKSDKKEIIKNWTMLKEKIIMFNNE